MCLENVIRYSEDTYVPVQILSRGKTDSASSRNASGGPGSGLGVGRQARKTPAPASLEDFIIRRDYTGARAFLEVRKDYFCPKFSGQSLLSFHILFSYTWQH